jgi:prepilin-type N-terminal cleavage/methylation domain-containing protein
LRFLQRFTVSGENLKRKAFTLIELLVVITIIAILAAIIFPVFSQAKAAAKKADAFENLHQINVATVMYEGDYSDLAPLDFASSPETYYTWQDLIQPYAKSYGIVFDPMSPYQNQDHTTANDYWESFGMLPEAGAVADGSYPNFVTRQIAWLQNYTPGGVMYDGIAGDGVDPLGWAGGNFNTVAGGVPSKDISSLPRPAEYAMVFTSGNWDGYHGVYGYPSGFGFCGGLGTIQNSYFGFQPRHSGGSDYCVTATRATDYGVGMALVSFADGHAKAMSSGALLVPDNGGGNFLKYWWPNQ